MRYPQQSEVSRNARATFRSRSDARNALLNEELLSKLLNAAFAVLLHNTAAGETWGDRQRKVLRQKFARILKIKV